jgi:hypothetical protein
VIPRLLYALTGPRLDALPERLPPLFRDPWVAGYTISFAPPLTRANRALEAGLRGVTGALDKLPVYLRTCVCDAREHTRLAWRHRAIQTRLHGPLEVEDIARAYAEVLGLDLVLHHPDRAPASLVDALRAAGVDPARLAPDAPRAERTLQLVVRFDDAHHPRLLERLRAAGRPVEGEDPYAIEVWVPAAIAPWVDAWTLARGGSELVAVGEPEAEVRDPHAAR